MKRGPDERRVAARCLTSPIKVTHDKLSVEDIMHMFRSSQVVDDTFTTWSTATGFDAAEDDAANHVDDFNNFEELEWLCERGGVHSPICLIKGSWLLGQKESEKSPIASRQAIPREALYLGRITEALVLIIVISYCWAGPGQPDPNNKLLSDVCEFLQYLETSRHYGDHNPTIKKLNIGDREILVFWDYSCMYQRSDGGVTLMQLDSFNRGLGHINVIYGHVGTMCLLCTDNYPVVERTGYKDSAWPYFESLVSMLIKDANKALDLPTVRKWLNMMGNDIVSDLPGTQANCSIFWLYEYVRRADRQLPVDPATFNTQITSKTATNGSDIDFLVIKFLDTFNAVMHPAKKIALENVPGATPEQWRLFLEVTLKECPLLVHVDISCNEAITDATLVPFAALHARWSF